MDGALKVVLLAALILLVSAKTSDTTHFPKELQVHIDKALINVRDTYKDHHVAFHSIIGEPRLMNSIYNVNLKLIVKECKKNTRSTDECVPQKLLYVIDCLLCKKKDNQELLDCAKFVDVKNKRRDDVRSTCRENFTGGNTLLLKDDQKMGRCTGCM
ncbi:cystatin-like protein isoform X1 [Tachysurus fulvidraco]|uniref:cystatin-like protein isoform X1 n=1 Tax=Tachysurus fulvidraco TaxID=1234273 RepID=UPI000F508232|nr:cystatin-like protein isoform X1 [Tachysurus fulvidraco]